MDVPNLFPLDTPFIPFPKIPRLSRECIVTEKIDGTNAIIRVLEDGTVLAGSRTRWVTPGKDNYGFASWVFEHAEQLRGLDVGTHYGEWWGKGIQRGYGLDHKRFSLFNTSRWNAQTPPPPCCHVVPVLYQGDFDTHVINALVLSLANMGSEAAPGFMSPEGVVVYHTAAGVQFKKTVHGDEKPKGAA